MNILNEHGFLSIFKKASKPNLTPPVDRPKQENLYFTSEDARSKGVNLRDLTASKLRGEGLGFGEDFVSKASNPVIASREARYNQIEAPAISNEFSKRGLARSAGANLATDSMIKAGQSKERDVNEILAQFYTLNEAQKKRDYTEAFGQAERSNAQQADLLGNAAQASENLTKATADDQIRRDTNTRGDLDRIGAMITTAVGAPSASSLSFIPGIGQVSASQPQQSQIRPTQNILGSVSSSQLGGMSVEQLLQLLGGA